MQSLELVLDDAADAVIRDQWARLAAAGLPSQARHTGETNRPHVTLDARDRPGDDARLTDAGLSLPVRLRVGGPLLFGVRRGWVLARHVVVDTALLALHDRAQELLGPGTSPLTESGTWVPHLTLAHGLASDQLPAALDLVGGEPALDAIAVAARRWDSEARRTWEV